MELKNIYNLENKLIEYRYSLYSEIKEQKRFYAFLNL